MTLRSTLVAKKMGRDTEMEINMARKTELHKIQKRYKTRSHPKVLENEEK